MSNKMEYWLVTFERFCTDYKSMRPQTDVLNEHPITWLREEIADREKDKCPPTALIMAIPITEEQYNEFWRG